MALRIYDPKDVVITFGSAGEVTGFADGSFVSIEFNEDFYSLQIGSDGEGTRSKSNNLSARITITLMQDSPSNDDLSTILKADLEADAIADGIQVKDLNGTSLYIAEKAWIVRYPTSEFGREATGREWIIETDNLADEQTNVGGNVLA